MNPLELLELAGRRFTKATSDVNPADWHLNSTCTDWTVRDICDHVVGGNRFSVAALAGLSVEASFAAAISPGFDGEPLDLYLESADEQRRSFTRPNALSEFVDHPMGQISGLEFLGYRVCDLVLHSWDLARSTNGDEHVDSDLAEFVCHQFADGSHRVFESGSYAAPRLRNSGQIVTTWDSALMMSGRTP